MSALEPSWPAAFLDREDADGIVIEGVFWQQGAPRGRGGPGPNPRKRAQLGGADWPGWAASPVILLFPVSKAPGGGHSRKGVLWWRAEADKGPDGPETVG